MKATAMTNKALVIQDNPIQTFDHNAFMTARNLVAEFCNTTAAAVYAIKSVRYRCVVVSTDMRWEDPIAIIGALRQAENTLGLSPTQIVVVGKPHQLTHAEMSKFNISAQIHSHYLK